MTDRADASCVYVKRALLTQLEREKRGLRWQLARAAKAAETHAADVAAYEAKLKDLLTIVEMNKSVADKAVKQTYSRESVVQKLQSEKQTLSTQLQRQHARAVVTMQQRSERRRRRAVWNAWVRVTRWHKDIKTRMRRILERQRRRRLESGFAQWKRTIGARMMTIQPSVVALEPLPSPTSSMCSRSTFSTVSEGLAAHKSLGFATWKAEWHARKRKHRLATQFAQLILVRRVVNAWKQAVRRRNWQNAMIMTAKQRRRQLCFIRWRQWTRRVALGRKALRRILKTKARRVLQREFSLFRLKCTEKCVAEWTEILKSARNAMEEERNMYALHQDAALQEIQERFTRQELAQRRFLEGQRHQLTQKRRREGLRVWFVRWQKRIELRRMQAQVAKHYAQVHVRRSRVRRVYVAWKQLHEQQKRVKILTQRVICRQQKILIVSCFLRLTRQLHRQIQRKRRLRLILIRRNKHTLIRSWARWHSVILLEEQEACAHLQTRELTTQLQVRETTWQYEAHRLQRVAYRYQLQNALHLGDTKRERQVRGVFAAWRRQVHTLRERRRVLARLIRRKTFKTCQLGLDQWCSRVLQLLQMQKEFLSFAHRRDARLLHHVVAAWRKSVQDQRVAQTQSRLQLFCLLLWRKRSLGQKQRNRQFIRLVQGQARKWQRQAFQSWRRKSQTAVLIEKRQQERQQELLVRLWARWQHRMLLASRRKARQHALISSKTFEREQKWNVRSVWAVWCAVVLRQRLVRRQAEWLGSHPLRRRLQKLRIWWGLRAHTQQQNQRRFALLRVEQSYCVRTLQRRWRHWTTLMRETRAIRVGRTQALPQMASIVHAQRRIRFLHQILKEWKRLVTRRRLIISTARRWKDNQRRRRLCECFFAWSREFRRDMRFRRQILSMVIHRRRRALQRLAIRRWESFSLDVALMVFGQRQQQQQQVARDRVLTLVRSAWVSKDLRASFVEWRFFAQRRKTQRQRVRTVLLRLTRVRIHSAWCRWRRCIALHTKVVQLSVIHARIRLRVAWKRFHSGFRGQIRKIEAITRLLRRLTRVSLRNGWNQWKRMHVQTLLLHADEKKTISDELLVAVMTRVGTRHFTKVLLIRVLTRWRQHAAQQKNLKHKMARMLRSRSHASVQACFKAWQQELCLNCDRRAQLRLVFRHGAIRRERLAFALWKRYTQDTNAQFQARATQFQLEQQRQQLARHLVQVMYSSWKRPTLTATLRAWKAVVDIKHRRVNELSRRLEERRRSQLAAVVFRAWVTCHDIECQVKRIVCGLLDGKRLGELAWGFRKWRERVWRANERLRALTRLATIQDQWHLRRAMRLFRLHQDTAMRRQSMMVVLSAQQALQRHKDEQKMRTVALLLQKREQNRLRETFSRWNGIIASKKRRIAVLQVVTRRCQRRTLRLLLRTWRNYADTRRTRAKRVQQSQQERARRLLGRILEEWRLYLRRRRDAAEAIAVITEQCLHSRLACAWKTWGRWILTMRLEEEARHEEHWRRSTMLQQSQMASLESKTERLLLESVQLKQTLQQQRQRCVESFARRVWSILAANLANRASRCFFRWMERVQLYKLAFEFIQQAYTTRIETAFTLWKHEASTRRVQQTMDSKESHLLERVALMLSMVSNQQHKKRVLTQWRAFVVHRHKKKREVLIAMTTQRHGDKTLLRACVVGWRRATREAKRQYATLVVLQSQRDRELLRACLRQWQHWRQAQHMRNSSLKALLLLEKQHWRRELMRSWCKWRTHTVEATSLFVKAKIAMLELEQWNQSSEREQEGRLLRVFANWKAFAQNQMEKRARLGRHQATEIERAVLRRHLQAWRRVVMLQRLARLKKQRPVICVQAPFGSRGQEKSWLCSLTEYRRRHRMRWRLQQSRQSLHRRVRRVLALSLLLKSLHRQHLRVIRRAFWVWFSRIQRISSALASIGFAALPWSRPTTSFSGSMLLLALEEMDLKDQTATAEATQRAWQAVDRTLRNFRKQFVRRAFDCWVFLSHMRARRPVSRRYQLVHPLRSDLIATGRAFLAKLHSIIKRKAFVTWKTQYVAWAIDSARQEELELLAALRDVTSYRQTLDPYSRPY